MEVEQPTTAPHRMSLAERNRARKGIKYGGTDPAVFRAALARVGLTPPELARILQELGDTRPIETIQRNVREMARPDRTAALPWLAKPLMTLLERAPMAWRDKP